MSVQSVSSGGLASVSTVPVDWRSLSASQAFQSALETDPELLRLDAARRNPEDDRHELSALIGGAFVLTAGSMTLILTPVTAGPIALLALMESPLLTGSVKATGFQIETALYILIKGRAAAMLTPDSLTLTAAKFFESAGELDYAEIGQDIRHLLHIAELPYVMLPSSSDSLPLTPHSSLFDLYSADWLSGLVARVSGVTNLRPDEIIWDLPMSAAAAYDIQYRRYVLRQANIRRRSTNAEAVEGYHARLQELAVEFSAAPSVKSVAAGPASPAAASHQSPVTSHSGGLRD
jgi:hypothetical protein